MREWITDIILGALLFLIGFSFGYFLGKPEPPTMEIVTEIKLLQKDIVRIETQAIKNLIKIEDLDKWRDSIIFRPPELPITKKKKEVK